MATALAAPVSLQNCPMQGRLVVGLTGNGQIGVLVPPSGQSVTGNALTISGDYELSVTNSNGQVTATTSSPSAQAQETASAAVSPAATDPACNETNYSTYGFRWKTTLNWYFNVYTATSRAGLDASGATAAIRAGNTNITTGANNCGLPVGSFSAHGSYKGTTSKYANINSAPDCLTRDGQNTVSFGPFDKATTLAYTCYWWNPSTGAALETDTYFGSNVGLRTSCPSGGGSRYDLETVATHEWGHSYGLDHATGRDEVMYPTVQACPAVRDHLGLGDWNGMDALYP